MKGGNCGLLEDTIIGYVCRDWGKSLSEYFNWVHYKYKSPTL